MSTKVLERINLEKNLSLVLGKRVSLLSPELKGLTKTDLKKAYFKRAKETHPDCAASVGLSTRLLEERFRVLQNAYDILEETWSEELLRTLVRVPQTTSQTRANARPAPKAQARTNVRTQTHSTSQARPTTRSNVRTKTHTQARTNVHSAQKTSPHSTRYKPRYIPPLSLRLGEYLYYTGKIDWHTFIAALSWQIINRPKIGDLAQEKGWLNNADIITILKSRNPGELFGQTAIRIGKLSSYEITILCGRQRLLNCPIGKYFTSHKILTEQELTDSVEALQRHNIYVKCRQRPKICT